MKGYFVRTPAGHVMKAFAAGINFHFRRSGGATPQWHMQIADRAKDIIIFGGENIFFHRGRGVLMATPMV